MVAGFRFGMMLQLAIGPVCLFILQAAMATSLAAAFGGVVGVTVADALFIGAALIGIGRVLQYERVKRFFPLFGAAVLFVFGVNTVLGAGAMPLLTVTPGQTMTATFSQALLLTMANPLTILFWTGVFATKMTEQQHLAAFSGGALLATFVFLGAVALVGHFVQVALSSAVVTILTIIVGIGLIGFAVRTMWREVRHV